MVVVVVVMMEDGQRGSRGGVVQCKAKIGPKVRVRFFLFLAPAGHRTHWLD
jgi:hypothetical protein